MKKVKLDLSEINGNAFALIVAFKHQARREGWTEAEIEPIVKECKSGDYDHLLQTLLTYCE